MTLIQIILSFGILLVGVYSYRKLRSSYLDAILIFGLAFVGLVFVFFPELSNKVAHFAGVGRGADMIFYTSIVFFAFVIMKLYAKVRRLEAIITEIVRKESIKNASGNADDQVSSTS